MKLFAIINFLLFNIVNGLKSNSPNEFVVSYNSTETVPVSSPMVLKDGVYWTQSGDFTHHFLQTSQLNLVDSCFTDSQSNYTSCFSNFFYQYEWHATVPLTGPVICYTYQMCLIRADRITSHEVHLSAVGETPDTSSINNVFKLLNSHIATSTVHSDPQLSLFVAQPGTYFLWLKPLYVQIKATLTTKRISDGKVFIADVTLSAPVTTPNHYVDGVIGVQPTYLVPYPPIYPPQKIKN